MAVLSDAERARIWRGIMRYWSAERTPCGTTKADLRAAVNAADAWIDANAAAYNSALPQPARGALTTEQKAVLLAITALVRFSPELVRRAIGEVD